MKPLITIKRSTVERCKSIAFGAFIIAIGAVLGLMLINGVANEIITIYG